MGKRYRSRVLALPVLVLESSTLAGIVWADARMNRLVYFDPPRSESSRKDAGGGCAVTVTECD